MSVQLVLVAVMSMLTALTLLVVITVPAILALLELGEYVLKVCALDQAWYGIVLIIIVP